MQSNKPTITFHGGAGSVTGSNFLLEVSGKRILVDCGLFQGDHVLQNNNAEPFPYNPASIDMVFITHAHIDHIGRLPKLVKEGFTGTIYATEATADLAHIMLEDSERVLAYHAKKNNTDPLYMAKDVLAAIKLFKGISYHYSLPITEDLSATLYDAGHVLGSAMVKFSHEDTNILFTGDLGNSPSPILHDSEILTDIDYLIMESVYGDRNHEDAETRTKKLQSVIEHTIAQQGTLMIPVFSLERTQEILFELDTLVEERIIPRLPVFLDSPLAIKATNIYKKHAENFNKTARKQINEGDDVFNFPGLTMTKTKEDSKEINEIPGPKIIMAGSGMSTGGRIVHHEMRYLPHPENTLLFVGYQAAGTLGRRILEGAKEIDIYHNSIPIHARIETINGYSGHKDGEHLLEFVHEMGPRIKQVFCVMGEPKSSMFLAQRIRDYLGVSADAPLSGTVIEIG
ncbi:MAG: metallo-beta-lactamase family protein [Planctomycetota bacterium]|jgi:metallo-beta-lactamase family protein